MAGHRSARTNRLVAAAATLCAIALIGIGCTDNNDGPPLLSGLGEQTIGLRTDLTCDELLDNTREQLEAELAMAESMARNDFDLDDVGGVEESFAVDGGTDAAEAAPATREAPATTASGEAGEVVAGTNNQETGVDEADIVKTDGARIVSLTEGVLRVVELDGTPGVDGTLDLRAFGPDAGGTEGAELFLRGDEALVLLPAWGGTYPVPEPMPVEPGIGDTGGVDLAEPALPQRTEEETPAEPAEESTTTSAPDGPTTTVEPTSTTTTEPTTTSTTTTSTTTTSSSTTTTAPAPVEPEPLPFHQGVRILRIDLGSPGDGSQPAVVEQRSVEGELVAARMIDGTARVVLRSPMPLVERTAQLGANASDGLDEARTLIEEIDTADVLPRATDTSGQEVTLGDCADVATIPAAGGEGLEEAVASGSFAPPSSPTNVSVLTVGEDLTDLAPTTVSGLADVVYASTAAVYVTSTGWGESGPVTLVHRFGLPADAGAAYSGSGAVPGTPLNQYSLSESGGDLRIVTTTEGMQTGNAPQQSPFGPDDMVDDGMVDDDMVDIAPVPASEGRLAVLRPDSSGELVEVGMLDDLGPGERVQSVRFLGDMAYVVTFRQTDPLYAIDLSDPTAPEALGELKITGFSEYLHPVGDGLLLGIGREATEEGFDTGFKASLFDVSDPTDPTEVDKVVIADGWSPVGNDPLAFTWDPDATNAIVPLERTGCPPNADCIAPVGPNQGALVLEVDGRTLAEGPLISHQQGASDPWRAQVQRSLVVDRDLWTLSNRGLGLSDADSPTQLTLVEF